MTVSIFTQPLEQLEAAALVMLVPQGADQKLPKPLAKHLPKAASESFRGTFGETLTLFPTTGTIGRILLVGLGDGTSDRGTMETFRRAIGTAVKQLLRAKASDVALYLGGIFDDAHIGEAVMTALAASYTYRHTKKDDATDLKSVVLVAPDAAVPTSLDRILKASCLIADSVRIARELINAPSNVMTPGALANAAKKLAGASEQLSCAVLGKTQLVKQGFGGILAVAQGSQHEPQLITLEYTPTKKAKKTIVLVGKGVTFDSGGINLKPERGMETMHMDMAGGATVLATVHAAAMLQLPIHIVGVVPAVENMPSGTALKPGDIITAKSGLTIEVANTDAEGRIVLADALTHAATFKPALIIDCATLTGAALVALGEERAAVLGNNQVLINDLVDTADDTGELLWQLPLDDDYREHVKSDTADVRNLGKRGNAGVIAGAAFLEKFVPTQTPWAHIDLAGPALRSEPGSYWPKNGTGWGVRLLTEFLLRQAS